MNVIFLVIGLGLVALGGAAGITLFGRAISDSPDRSANTNATLWGLFLIGMAGGLIAMAISSQLR